MSYREIRNLIEHMRALAFNRTISMENFSTPNFPLLTEIIIWAIKIIDHEYEISGVIDTEHDRVLLIRIAAIFFYQKLGIRVNTVKLYGADKLAARELLKVTCTLYKATQTALHRASEDDGVEPLLEDNYRPNITGKDLREVRQLASSIVMDAASLHDSLNNEVDDKIKREATLNQSLDVDRLEATLVAALHALSGTVEEIKEATELLEKQGTEIEEKIQKKKESVVRNCRRLEALNRIKPTWQTEFEQEEAELRATWEEYIVKHKNLAYLEHQLDELDEQQHQQLNTAMQLGKAAAAADLIALEGTKEQLQNRNRRVFGTMTGENIDSSEDSSSTDSFLNDSASDDDSLTLLSKDEPLTAARALGNVSSSAQKRESLHDYSLYSQPPLKTLSGKPGQRQRRPSSARPKSAHSSESRVGSLTAWTGNVKGSERVSPLSDSEDNSEGF